MTSGDSTATQWRDLTEDERHIWANQVAGMVIVDRKAQSIIAHGECPNCGHPFDFRSSDQAIHVEARGIHDRINNLLHPTDQPTGFDWNGRLRFLIACYCDHPHPGRPGTTSHGCGASGWLEDHPE